MKYIALTMPTNDKENRGITQMNTSETGTRQRWGEGNSWPMTWDEMRKTQRQKAKAKWASRRSELIEALMQLSIILLGFVTAVTIVLPLIKLIL
jgi:hypothetical protein